MNFSRFLGKVASGIKVMKSEIQPSFSQAGEDQIIRYLAFNILKNPKPSYLDIGTNHPYRSSNTFYFYTRGSRGVCIEPDEKFAKLIRKYRKGDVFIQGGVAAGNLNEAVLYAFPGEYCTWNTFSEEEALKRQDESGVAFSKIEKVKLVNINDVMSKYFSPHPNIISLDVEGLDFDILQSIDFNRFRPEIICVESISFSVTNEEEKNKEMIDFVTSKGYVVFGDTHINTIFCRADVLKMHHE